MGIGELLDGPKEYILVIIPCLLLFILIPFVKGAGISGIVSLLIIFAALFKLLVEDISGARPLGEPSTQRIRLTWLIILTYVAVTVFLILRNRRK